MEQFFQRAQTVQFCSIQVRSHKLKCLQGKYSPDIKRNFAYNKVKVKHRNRLLRLSVECLFSVAWTPWRWGWTHFYQKQFMLRCSCHRAETWATWSLVISSSPIFQWFHILKDNFKILVVISFSKHWVLHHFHSWKYLYFS